MLPEGKFKVSSDNYFCLVMSTIISGNFMLLNRGEKFTVTVTKRVFFQDEFVNNINNAFLEDFHDLSNGQTHFRIRPGNYAKSGSPNGLNGRMLIIRGRDCPVTKI